MNYIFSNKTLSQTKLQRRWRRRLTSWSWRDWSEVWERKLQVVGADVIELCLHFAQVSFVHLGRFVGRVGPGHFRQVGNGPRLKLSLELRGVAGLRLLADGPLPAL